MALNKDQLQRLKNLQAYKKNYCERMGYKSAHPINYELLEQYQEQPSKVELDQQTTKDIQEQVKKQVQQAIDNGLKDLFK